MYRFSDIPNDIIRCSKMTDRRAYENRRLLSELKLPSGHLRFNIFIVTHTHTRERFCSMTNSMFRTGSVPCCQRAISPSTNTSVSRRSVPYNYWHESVPLTTIQTNTYLLDKANRFLRRFLSSTLYYSSFHNTIYYSLFPLERANGRRLRQTKKFIYANARV